MADTTSNSITAIGIVALAAAVASLIIHAAK